MTLLKTASKREETDPSAPRDRTKNRPTSRRSGNPAVRNGAIDIAPDTSAVPAKRSRIGVVAGTLLALVLLGGYTTFVLYLPASSGNSTLVLALLAVPALITMLFVPQARTRGLYRWPAALALGFFASSNFIIPVLVATQTWVVVRFWLIESRPTWPLDNARIRATLASKIRRPKTRRA